MLAKKIRRNWSDPKAIKKSLTNLLNAYIAGEIEAEVLRNVIYAANCLINCCKTINEEEVQELKDMIQEIQEASKNE